MLIFFKLVLWTSAYFWGHIVGGATKSVCHPVEEDLQLAHAEVGYPDVSVEIQQDVVEFQISAVDKIETKLTSKSLWVSVVQGEEKSAASNFTRCG